MRASNSFGGQLGATGPSVDHSAALELSAKLADENRLSFAQTFSAEITANYGRAVAPRGGGPDLPTPPLDDGTPLSREARQAANRIAVGLEGLPLVEAAYVIGTLYSALLPDPYRARHGVFYTPPELVECLLDMAEEAGTNWKTARVLDPACGGGAFLIGVAMRMARALDGIEPAIVLNSVAGRLRGFDLDPFGTWLARAMVAIVLDPVARRAGRSVPGFVETRDSLDPRSDDEESFDLVIGNPPYGRVTLSPEQRRRFARSVYGHANMYGVFTDTALRLVKSGGVIACLTPTSMLSGLYYKALRALLVTQAPPLSVNFISKRDGVFADVLQETMLATYRKGGIPVAGKVGFIDAAQSRKIVSRTAGRFALPANPSSPWLLPRTAEQARLARRLRSMPHRLADYGYGISTGPLVWNRHKAQFREKPEPGARPVIWAEAVTSDGRFVWRSKRRNHVPWFAPVPPKDDWLIVTTPCVLVQRTTAKEQARRLIAAELPASFIRQHKGVTVENHLNMVRGIRPSPTVPAAVIATLLNSAAVDAAFRCLNGSVAVSAFELEELPLPAPAMMAKLARFVVAGASSAKIAGAISAAYGDRDAAAAP